jgi:hypothetical protein
MGYESRMMGYWVKTFFISKMARIDYKKGEILMGDVRLKFDDRVVLDQVKEVSIVLKARCETVVKFPTNSEELKVGLISKQLLPGIIMAETNCSTRGRMPYQRFEQE